jgi:hypothetical protein
MTELLWFLLGIILLIGAILLLKKAIKEGKKAQPTDASLYLDLENETSSENIDILKTFRVMHLRNKLEEIEHKRGISNKSEDIQK